MFSVRHAVPRGPTVSSTSTTSKRRYKLTGSRQFDRVFKRSRRSADRFFTVLYCANDLRYPRLGLAIAKRNVRLAVQRNRLKRIIRESFRMARSQLPACDVVVIAKPPAVRADNSELLTSLKQHWQSLQQSSEDRQRNH